MMSYVPYFDFNFFLQKTKQQVIPVLHIVINFIIYEKHSSL